MFKKKVGNFAELLVKVIIDLFFYFMLLDIHFIVKLYVCMQFFLNYDSIADTIYSPSLTNIDKF